MADNERLKLEEKPVFQRLEWRIQRVGWVLWAAIVIAACAGLMGRGPLSATEASAPDGSLPGV